MTIPVNGYSRVRLGHTEYIESHLRDEPTRFTHKGGTSNTPMRTPEQLKELRSKFKRPFH